MSRIIEVVLCWLWAIGIFSFFSYRIFWEEDSGWWYVLALIFISMVRPTEIEKKEEEEDDKE